MFPALFMDAAVIAVVAYVISHSVGSVFAAKHGYEIRANQEFLAQGCSNVFGSFFSSLPMACSLSRCVFYWVGEYWRYSDIRYLVKL